jgi:hypothetical protein
MAVATAPVPGGAAKQGQQVGLGAELDADLALADPGRGAARVIINLTHPQAFAHPPVSTIRTASGSYPAKVLQGKLLGCCVAGLLAFTVAAG